MNKVIISAIAFASLGATVSNAQAFDPTINLKVEARVDYAREYDDDNLNESATGFKGRYFNLQLNGDINKHFSYNLRQRLNKSSYDASFFDATDWVYLSYHPNAQWDFSAGKQVVGIGGYEYDKAPIDVYRGSEFWNNIPCYEMGVNIYYNIPKTHDQLMLQACESPFRLQSNSNMYAYNLMWYGHHSFYESMWSLNMVEYQKNKYISYIALGNKFKFDKFSLTVDFMNRASSGQAYLFKDFSLIGELNYRINRKFNVFAKGTFDYNKTTHDKDFLVYSGTNMKMAGAGLEYFPLQNSRHDVRLHAFCFYSWGKNSNLSGTLQNKSTFIDLGVTWRVQLLKSKK